MRRYYVPLLRLKAVKAVVLTGFISFCAAMVYCASNLEQDFDVVRPTPTRTRARARARTPTPTQS